jgi:hypothetical protein
MIYRNSTGSTVFCITKFKVICQKAILPISVASLQTLLLVCGISKPVDFNVLHFSLILVKNIQLPNLSHTWSSPWYKGNGYSSQHVSMSTRRPSGQHKQIRYVKKLVFVLHRIWQSNKNKLKTASKPLSRLASSTGDGDSYYFIVSIYLRFHLFGNYSYVSDVSDDPDGIFACWVQRPLSMKQPEFALS